eukprot:1137651-Pelagomonas_calceolata.AAC.2
MGTRALSAYPRVALLGTSCPRATCPPPPKSSPHCTRPVASALHPMHLWHSMQVRAMAWAAAPAVMGNTQQRSSPCPLFHCQSQLQPSEDRPQQALMACVLQARCRHLGQKQGAARKNARRRSSQ